MYRLYRKAREKSAEAREKSAEAREKSAEARERRNIRLSPVSPVISGARPLPIHVFNIFQLGSLLLPSISSLTYNCTCILLLPTTLPLPLCHAAHLTRLVCLAQPNNREKDMGAKKIVNMTGVSTTITDPATGVCERVVVVDTQHAPLLRELGCCTVASTGYTCR